MPAIAGTCFDDAIRRRTLFFSFFAVKRAGRAFLVYGLAWSLIVTLVPAAVNLLLMLITGSANARR